MFICEKHLVESNTISHVRSQTESNICAVCGSEGKILDTGSFEVQNLMKALLRYNHDEVEYNSHYGGGYISEILLSVNFIFNNDIYENPDIYKELEGELAGINDHRLGGIGLNAGFDENGVSNTLNKTPLNSFHPFFHKISEKLARSNYHDFEDELREIIRDYGNSFSKVIEGGSIVYRARVGVSGYKKAHLDFSPDGKKIYNPYQCDDIGAVPPLKATGGRANRVGVSYLYCATDNYTAIAEVRPHPTDLVSIGTFSVKFALKVFDFANPNILGFIESDDKLMQIIPYAKMAEVFNTATPPSLEGRYCLSQLISDCIRKEGFDGIQFSSTVGMGKNLVVFNPSKMSFIAGRSEVVEIIKVEYAYQKKQLVGVDDHFEIYPDEDI